MSDRLVAQGEGFAAGTEPIIAVKNDLAKNADVWRIRSLNYGWKSYPLLDDMQPLLNIRALPVIAGFGW